MFEHVLNMNYSSQDELFTSLEGTSQTMVKYFQEIVIKSRTCSNILIPTPIPIDPEQVKTWFIIHYKHSFCPLRFTEKSEND